MRINYTYNKAQKKGVLLQENHRLKLVECHAEILHSVKSVLATASHCLFLPIRKKKKKVGSFVPTF